MFSNSKVQTLPEHVYRLFKTLIKSSSTLLGDTNSLSTTTGGLGVLSTDTKTPVVPETTVVPA